MQRQAGIKGEVEERRGRGREGRRGLSDEEEEPILPVVGSPWFSRQL